MFLDNGTDVIFPSPVFKQTAKSSVICVQRDTQFGETYWQILFPIQSLGRGYRVILFVPAVLRAVSVHSILTLDERKGAEFSRPALWFGPFRYTWPIYLFGHWKPALRTIITGRYYVGWENGSAEGNQRLPNSFSSAVPGHNSHPWPPRFPHGVIKMDQQLVNNHPEAIKS